MYVCLCQGVREAEVADAVASGADDMDGLVEALGVCTGCGCCRELVEALLDKPRPAGRRRAMDAFNRITIASAS